MPFVLVVIAVMLIAIGYNGKTKDAIALVRSDFTGPNNFVVWITALFVIGLVGYLPKAKTLSNTFMLLVILAMVISNKGFFNNFLNAVNNLQPSPDTSPNGGIDPVSGVPNLLKSITPSWYDNVSPSILGNPDKRFLDSINPFR